MSDVKNAVLTMGLGLGLAAVIGMASVAAAQPVLQRLEEAIRQRTSEGPNAIEPAPQPASPENVPPAPVETARQRADQGPGYLGAIADDRKDRGRGVRVLQVREGGPAAKAGLQPNDLIVSVGGVRVRQMSDLADVLALFPPGSTLGLEILRGDKPQVLKVTLGRQSAAKPPVAKPRVVRPPAAGLPGLIPPPPGADQSPGERSIPEMPAPPQNPPSGPPLAAPEEPPLAGPKLPVPNAPADRVAEQEAKIQELQRRIEQLQQQNKQLQQQIEQLEKALAEAAKKQ